MTWPAAKVRGTATAATRDSSRGPSVSNTGTCVRASIAAWSPMSIGDEYHTPARMPATGAPRGRRRAGPDHVSGGVQRALTPAAAVDPHAERDDRCQQRERRCDRERDQRHAGDDLEYAHRVACRVAGRPRA